MHYRAIENVQLVTSKNTPRKLHHFNAGICSFFPCWGEQAGVTSVSRGSEAVLWLSATLQTVVPVGTGVYSKPEAVPTKLHILNQVLCTICTTENQRSPHLLFYCSQSLTRRIRTHSTSTNSDLASSLKPTTQTKETSLCDMQYFEEIVKRNRLSFLLFFLSFPPDSTVF